LSAVDSRDGLNLVLPGVQNDVPASTFFRFWAFSVNVKTSNANGLICSLTEMLYWNWNSFTFFTYHKDVHFAVLLAGVWRVESVREPLQELASD